MSLQQKTVCVRLVGCALLVALTLMVGAAQPDQQVSPVSAPLVNQSVPATEPQAVNPHRRQLADDSARLLSLAIALKAEVDKTTKDTLSLNVIRKADEIEKLAHTVREQLKSSGASK